MFWRAYAILAHVGDRLGIRIERRRRPPRPAQNIAQVAKKLERLDAAFWTSSTLAAAAESGLLEALLEPRDAAELAALARMPPEIASALVEVLIAEGLAAQSGDRYQLAPGFRATLEQNGAAWVSGVLSATRLQADDLRARAAAGSLDLSGWRHADPAIIRAQGDVTAGMASEAVRRLGALPGLPAALHQPGAAFLDVGAGAAALSITLCRNFPQLRAVALEPSEPSVAVADQNISEAGLSHRIVMRRQRVEELAESDHFDLAFLPEMFLSGAAFGQALPKLRAALKPHGWLLVATAAQPGGDPMSAVGRLKSLMWGGNIRFGTFIRDQLAGAGFDPVIRSPGSGAIRMICARRPG